MGIKIMQNGAHCFISLVSLSLADVNYAMIPIHIITCIRQIRSSCRYGISIRKSSEIVHGPHRSRCQPLSYPTRKQSATGAMEGRQLAVSSVRSCISK